MSSTTDLGEIVGKSLTDDLAGKIALRATKVAALGAEHLLPSEDGSLGVVDLDNPLFHGDGYNTKLLAAGTYTKAPELFYGPFMQFGSYLKGKGVIQSDALALGLDLFGPDPINLATLGTGGLIEDATKGVISGLTRSGQVAKLAGAIRDVHGALTGAELVTHVADALEGAAKVAGVSEELAVAAKAGDSKAAISIVKAALDSGKLTEEDAALLTKLRGSGKAMGDVMKNADAIAAKGVLPESSYLGETIGERISRGQVNPFLKIQKPDILKPWNIPLQMMGFETKGATYWIPGTKNIAGGLEKAVANTPEQAAYNATVGMSMLRVMNGTTQEQVFRDLGAAGIDDAKLEELFRSSRKPSLSPNTDLTNHPEFEAWKERLADNFLNVQRRDDVARVAQFDQIVQQTVQATQGMQAGAAGQDLAVRNINAAHAEQIPSMLRRVHDEMGVRALQRDMNEPGFGLPARQALNTLVTHDTVTAMRDSIAQGYTGPLMREAIAEAFGPLVAHPSLTEERAGRLVLTATPEEVRATSPFLDAMLGRAGTVPATAGLEARLRTEGLDAGVSQMVKHAQITLDSTGKNLLHEGVVQGFKRDYFPRVFVGNDKFFKEFGGSVNDVNSAMERLFATDEGEKVLAGLMEGVGPKELLDKAGQGKLTMAEARKWTEDVAQRMEAGGYGVYKKDALDLFGHYSEAAHSALMVNRMIHDLPRMAGPMTEGEIIQRIGLKGLNSLTGDERMAIRRVMSVDSARDIPKAWRDQMTRIDPRYRTVPLRADTESLLARAQAQTEKAPLANPEAVAAETGAAFRSGERDVTQNRKALDAARRTVATRLDGEVNIGDVIVRDAATKKPRPIKGDWVRTGRVPSTVARPMEVKAALRREVEREALASSPKLAREARIAETRAAAADHAVRPTVAKELWVYTPDYAHLQQALHLYGKGEGVPGWLRAYRNWNYRFKSILLSGDVYHLNNLAITQLMTDPAGVLKFMASAKGLQRAALGAAVGGGVGLVSGRDAQGTAGLSLVGALYGASLSAALERAGQAGRYAMNPGHLDSLFWMAKGGWTGRPTDRAIGAAGLWLKTLRDKLATDVQQGGSKAWISPIDKTRFIAEAWDKTLWESMHNGSKHFYFDTVWRRELPRLEAKAEFQTAALKAEFDEARAKGALLAGDTTANRYVLRRQDEMRSALAREVMQSANNFFGGQRWSNLLDHPEMQRTARDVLLSPDWTASATARTTSYLMNMSPMTRAALGAGLGEAMDYVQNGGDTSAMHPARAGALGAALFFGLGKWADGIQRRMMVPGDVMRKEAARMSAAALLGGYTFANALNYAFTGRYLWENDEGRKTQIGLGDGTYVALGKPWVEAFEFAGVYHPEKYPAPVASRLFSKAAPIPHAVLRVLTNTNDWGGPLISPDDGPLDIAYKDMSFAIDAVAPIGLQGVGRVGAAVTTGQFDPRQLQAGLLRTAGFQAAVPAVRRGVGSLLGGPMGEPGNLSDLLQGPPSLGDPTNLLAGRL